MFYATGISNMLSCTFYHLPYKEKKFWGKIRLEKILVGEIFSHLMNIQLFSPQPNLQI